MSEQLRARIPPERLDEVIGRVHDLQEAARAQARALTEEDVAAVAEELGLDRSLVRAALDDLHADDAAAAAEAERAAAEAARRRAALTRGVGAVAIVVVLLVGGLGLSGSMAASSAAADVRSAQAALEQVLDRQAALAPQLVALSGGKDPGLAGKAGAVRSAGSLDERLAATDALRLAMAEALGSLPPPSGDAAAQQRLELQHEVTGSQNRIETESRRYREAMARAEGVAGRIDVRVARGIGLAGDPTAP